MRHAKLRDVSSQCLLSFFLSGIIFCLADAVNLLVFWLYPALPCVLLSCLWSIRSQTQVCHNPFTDNRSEVSLNLMGPLGQGVDCPQPVGTNISEGSYNELCSCSGLFWQPLHYCRIVHKVCSRRLFLAQ